MADDQGWTGLDERQEPAQTGERRGTCVSKWSLLVLGLAIVLAVILGQNTERVEVEVTKDDSEGRNSSLDRNCAA